MVFFVYFNICKSRFESDGEESEEEEKILDKHEKPEPLSAFIHSTRYWLLATVEVIFGLKPWLIHFNSERCFSSNMLWK